MSRENAREVMQDLARYVESKIGKKYGFAILIYEHDTDKGRLNYVSNSDREDVVEAMKEFIKSTEDSYGTHKL